MRRDLIGIGGSAGSLTGLRSLLETYRPKTPAAVFVVLHRGREYSAHLVDLLQASTPMPVREPGEGDAIEAGVVYLAPADRHMLIADGHIHLRRGPRENNFRPSIDPLFRSLAVFGSTRAMGVILSGYMDDGAAGLRALTHCGGLAFVEDPSEAQTPEMPRAAISAAGEPELIARPAEIGRALAERTGEAAPAAIPAPSSVKVELMIAALEGASIETEDRLGQLTPYNCPECNGVLWRLEDGPITRFRCHTGHAYSTTSLVESQAVSIEQSLYDVLRSQRERARLLRQVAEKEPTLRGHFLARAEACDEDSAVVESLLKRLSPAPH